MMHLPEGDAGDRLRHEPHRHEHEDHRQAECAAGVSPVPSEVRWRGLGLSKGGGVVEGGDAGGPQEQAEGRA